MTEINADKVIENPLDETVAASMREADWKELHWRLRSLAQQRVALEAQEASLILEAEESRLYRRLGYVSMTEYMERELHYGPHAANERLRVARELLSLPLIAEQFRAGEISFSAVRELSRVATPENEHLFLTKAHGRTARDVERMVAGLKRGDDPDADPDPKRIKKRVMFEISVPLYARYRRMRTELDKQRPERISDEELLGLLLSVESSEVTIPAVQLAMTTCKACKQSSIGADGQQLPIDKTTAERLACDAELIGDLETSDLTRPTSNIPAAIRRKVMHRDGYACVVTGCRSKKHLEVHHRRERQHGGKHTVENCCTLCDGHHTQSHDGRLLISGDAPDLTFTWRPDDGVETATNAPPLEWIEDDPAPNGTEASPPP